MKAFYLNIFWLSDFPFRFECVFFILKIFIHLWHGDKNCYLPVLLHVMSFGMPFKMIWHHIRQYPNHDRQNVDSGKRDEEVCWCLCFNVDLCDMPRGVC